MEVNANTVSLNSLGSPFMCIRLTLNTLFISNCCIISTAAWLGYLKIRGRLDYTSKDVLLSQLIPNVLLVIDNIQKYHVIEVDFSRFFCSAIGVRN